MPTRSSIAHATKQAAARLLRSTGYGVHRLDRTPSAQWAADAEPLKARHRSQTLADVEAARARYEAPVFGVVPVWDVVEMLAHVIDPSDRFLMNASQEVHTLQVVEGLIDEGVDDEDLLLAGLLHDVGKVLLLVGEDPAFVSGTTEPIGEYAPGVGLDRCVLQYNADDFAHSRLHAHVPDHVGWLIRYHSIVPEACVHLMDDRDRDYYERYGKQLHRLDHETKSIVRMPRTRIGDYRDLVERALPDPIPF